MSASKVAALSLNDEKGITMSIDIDGTILTDAEVIDGRTQPIEEPLVAADLIEEVSIDGMCGVY